MGNVSVLSRIGSVANDACASLGRPKIRSVTIGSEKVVAFWMVNTYLKVFIPEKEDLSLTLNRTICFSPAFTFRATSSSVRCRHRLSYDVLEPALASFSRVSASTSGEQKHR